MTESNGTELAVVNAANAVEIFTRGGLDVLLDGIESKVRALPLDESTPKGREEIRGVAYKVTRTKTALDAEAKKLTEGWRTSTAQVNSERKRAQERLDSLAEEVRAPLTAFENKEKQRIAGHESALAEIAGMMEMARKYPGMDAALIESHADDLKVLHAERNWEEFGSRATRVRGEVSAYLAERLTARRKFDSDQEELERLRKETAERAIREREQRAADAARIEAERRAKEAADAEARRVIEAAQKEQARVQAEAERIRAETEMVQRAAEVARQREQEAREMAERRAVEAAADAARQQAILKDFAEKARLKAESDLKESKEKAKRDADAAVAKERERAESQRKAEESARLKREADDRNRAKIRAEISEDIRHCDGVAGIVEAIMSGKVRHVTVNY